MQEYEQVEMRQAVLWILNTIVVPHTLTENVMIAQVIKEGLNLKIVDPCNSVWPIRCS
jgi:hypothetical protein